MIDESGIRFVAGLYIVRCVRKSEESLIVSDRVVYNLHWDQAGCRKQEVRSGGQGDGKWTGTHVNPVVFFTPANTVEMANASSA